MSDVFPSVSTPTEADASRDAVTTTIEIAASPERVFAALTDPQELAAWWGSEDGYRTCDWRVDARTGGEWSARTVEPSGNDGSISGLYTEVDPPSTLESTWRASWDDERVTTVRYDLTPIIVDDRPGTRVTVTHTGFNGLVACACARSAHATALRDILAIGVRSRIARRPSTCAA